MRTGDGERETENRARRTGELYRTDESGGERRSNKSCGVRTQDREFQRASSGTIDSTHGRTKTRLNERTAMAPLVYGSEILN